MRKLSSSHLFATGLLAAAATFASAVFAQGVQIGGSAKAGTDAKPEASGSATTKPAPQAEPKPAPQAAPKPAPAPAANTPKDPQGVTGISPFWEAVNQGDAAYHAQDFEGASAAYQKAITSEPKNAIGHLRMAELSLKQGELERAGEFVTSALRFAQDIRYKAQAKFLMAEVLERKADYDGALTAWREYKALDSALPAKTEAPKRGPAPPVVYVATADQRTTSIEAKKKLDEEYAAVRERIQANIDRADEATGGKKAEEKTEEKK